MTFYIGLRIVVLFQFHNKRSVMNIHGYTCGQWRRDIANTCGHFRGNGHQYRGQAHGLLFTGESVRSVGGGQV